MNLSLLKTVGQSMANDYSINWENWTEEETSLTEKTNKVNTLYYEKLFNSFDLGNEKHTLELFEDILENLVSVYMIETLLERKKAVDTLLSSV